MLTVLRNRTFALLWTGSLLSQVGSSMLAAALPYYVYQVSHSVAASGTAMMSGFLPHVIFNTVGGVFADRLPRKLVLILGDALRGLLVLPLLGVHDVSTLWIVYAAGFLSSTVASLAGPFSNAALPHVVPKEDLAAANGAFSVASNTAMIVGAPLGGIVLGRFGLSPVVVVDVISFAFPTVAMILINVPLEARERGTAHPHGVFRDWLLGWRYAWNTPIVMRVFVVSIPMFFGSNVILVVFVPFVEHVLHGSPQYYAWTQTAEAISSIAGGMVVGRVTTRVGPSGTIAASQVAIGLLAVIVAGAASQPITLIASLLLGAPVLFSDAMSTSLLQAGVSDAFRGRIFGTYISSVNVVGLIGTIVTTATADRIGIRLAFALGGVILGASGIAAVMLLPPHLPDLGPGGDPIPSGSEA